MLSYVLSSANTYFHLPIDDEVEEIDGDALTPQRNAPVTNLDCPLQSSTPIHDIPFTDRRRVIHEILSHNDLYRVLGISKSATLQKVELRRAYLSRSKSCHPDKFPDDPDATSAFQKVSLAYEILSNPSSKRIYDSRSSSYDIYAARPTGNAEETFQSVIIGVFNDFLDGDLEVIRALLRTINDFNPALRLGDDGINSVLLTVENIRERALTCRTLIFSLHAEMTRLLEVQHAFRQLSYLDLMGRSRLTIQLTRITLSLPVALERALLEQSAVYGVPRNPDLSSGEAAQTGALLPTHVSTLIKAIDIVLERIERFLG